MRALIYVEGKDDLAALTELYKRFYGFTVLREGERLYLEPESRLLGHAARGDRLEIIKGKDRQQALLQAAANYHERKYANNHIDRVGVVFDPDGDTDRQWREQIETAFGLSPEGRELELGGYPLERFTTTTILLPVPWDVGGVLDELDADRRCLERVGLDVVERACPDQGTLIIELLDRIRARGIPVTWKTAFRLLNAIRKPDTTEDGFVSQVFGQDAPLREGILPALQSTSLWARLAYLGGETVSAAAPTQTSGRLTP
jgi:hypothetical protein